MKQLSSVETFSIFRLGLLLFLPLFSCGGGGSSVPTNSIKIEEIIPASSSTGFTITVAYELRTAESGVICHSFVPYYGDRSSDTWTGCPMSIDGGNGGIPVNRGHGIITFTDTEPLAPGGLLYQSEPPSQFELRVILIPYENSNSTDGVVLDTQIVSININQ